MTRVVASVEARMGASRLPGKVLADIGGVPALGRLVRRLRRARQVADIVLATTTSAADDAIVDWARSESLAVHRGSEADVLGRVVGAHRAMDSDVIVELCGDTPLLDPTVIDLAVERFRDGDCDVVSTTWRPSYPQGIDAQVFRRDALEEVAATVDDPAVREHVSLFFYEHPERYRIVHLEAPPALRLPAQRLQLDWPEDLALIRAVYARLGPSLGDAFGTAEIVALLRAEPGLAALNADRRERAARP
ncbi:MAG: spore coat biosynthesis protein F [Alphaproteobacteria bacterium]|nr:spore coat biosynthesis protein F [Alphaproteobacteria bacterium]